MIQLVAGTVIAGKLRLERPLGRGPMGWVWSAHHLVLGKPVAAKLIAQAHAADGAVVELERAARAAANLRCPNAVDIYEWGLAEDVFYIVMEQLEGEDLATRLRRERRLSLPKAAEVAEQAAHALRAAQENSLVHGDLRPSNIFLARAGAEEVVKILDFGIAQKVLAPPRDEVAEMEPSVAFIGSPSYMSPEQLHGTRAVDPRTDLWALAAILFRAATGRPPFEAPSFADVVMNICHGSPPVASRIAPDLPAEIDAFFVRAFARDAGARFQTARELADAFRLASLRQGPAAQTVPAVAPFPIRPVAPPSPMGVPANPRLQPFQPAAPSVILVPFTSGPTPQPQNDQPRKMGRTVYTVLALIGVIVVCVIVLVARRTLDHLDSTVDQIGSPRRAAPPPKKSTFGF